MVKLGTYYAERQLIRDIQSQPEIKFHIMGTVNSLQYSSPEKSRGFQVWGTYNILLNFTDIQRRFDIARDNKDGYDYGCFILTEEVWNPSLHVWWGQTTMSAWPISGNMTLPNGETLMLLKDWYVVNKGAWNQSWWDNAKAANDPGETIVYEWSAWYGYTLLRGWHEFMHSIGKKSAIFGICGFNSDNFDYDMRHDFFPGQMLDYMINNYDLVTTGVHPITMSDIARDISWLKQLRDWGYTGKIVHIIPGCWYDGWGCPWNRDVAKEDMKQAMAYANVILVLPFADTSEWMVDESNISQYTQYIPIAIEWMNEFVELCPSLQIQISMPDRSRRATNPDNYNENGTVKKGKKGSKNWKKSNRYKATNLELSETDRILAAHRKALHGRDINEILTIGTRIKTEDVSYKAWQKMFGKSIGFRAPSMFISSLKRKAENAGGYMIEFPTQTTKLSQTCHICEEAVKKPLSQRWHICCGIEMQRDLYAAYLAKCVDVNTGTLDIAKAKQLWQGMEPILSEAISRAKQTAIGKVCPASFGFSGIQSQSSSLVNPATIISEAMDDVIHQTMDESHRELV